LAVTRDKAITPPYCTHKKDEKRGVLEEAEGGEERREGEYSPAVKTHRSVEARAQQPGSIVRQNAIICSAFSVLNL
jgi:hypothetical protein